MLYNLKTLVDRKGSQTATKRYKVNVNAETALHDMNIKYSEKFQMNDLYLNKFNLRCVVLK